jgi:membrane protein implicated in regulation of membrane protease activity
MQQFGKILIIIGAATILVGALLLLAGKLPWIGRLPGDIVVQKKNFTFYFPIATSILISILLTLIFWLFGRK